MNTSNSFFKTHLLNLTLLTLPFLMIAFFWGQMPETIPIHWNASGEADDFGSRWHLFLMPFINIAVFLLFLVIPKIDPKKKFDQFGKTYQILMNILITLFFLIFCVILLTVLGMIDNSTKWILYLLVGLFLLMGNYLGKIRPNYFLGIRTPWALENEEVWIKTHRFGGRVWVISSLVMLLLSFFVPSTSFVGLFTIYVGIIAFVPIIYSYLRYKEIK